MFSLTVLIGENDSGKTTVVRALQLLLSNANAGSEDFFRSEQGDLVETIEIVGTFKLNEGEADGGLAYQDDSGRYIILRKVYSANSGRSEAAVFNEIYDDRRLNDYFSMSAADLKSLAVSLGLRAAQTKSENIENIGKNIDTSNYPKTLGWQSVSFSEIEVYLPLYEPVLSTDYRDPSILIQNSIQSSMQDRIRQMETPDHEMHQTARNLQEWVEGEVDKEVQAMPEYVKSSLPKVQGVKVSARVDLSRSVTVSTVALDMGRGYHPLANYGEGTRKKIWMSILEWRQKSQEEARVSRPIIRVYDEPDLNLDYAAEKRLFEYISSSSKSEESKVQNILCTHSVTLVDRAPAEAINLIRVLDDESREVVHLNTVGGLSVEDRIKEFFADIGSQLQIRNTELFYEKGFLVFEGETEEELLPLLYRTLFGRSISEDGIVLLNMHTCGNWRTTLEFLGVNRKSKTVILLDRDATFAESSARISEQALREIGFLDGMFFVGQKELEDAFDDDVIADAMERRFPREDGYTWHPNHIRIIRENLVDENPKFSDDLKKFVLTSTVKNLRSQVKKVSIGQALGQACRADRVPREIIEALRAVRQRAGLD